MAQGLLENTERCVGGGMNLDQRRVARERCGERAALLSRVEERRVLPQDRPADRKRGEGFTVWN